MVDRDAEGTQRATFMTGLCSVFRAFGQLARMPGVWPFALVPTLLFAVLAALGVWGSFQWLEPMLRAWLAVQAGRLGAIGGGLVSFVGAALASLASTLVAFVSTPPLSAPA